MLYIDGLVIIELSPSTYSKRSKVKREVRKSIFFESERAAYRHKTHVRSLKPRGEPRISIEDQSSAAGHRFEGAFCQSKRAATCRHNTHVLPLKPRGEPRNPFETKFRPHAAAPKERFCIWFGQKKAQTVTSTISHTMG